jgi:type IV pilus assembly protein PilY1
VIKKYLIIFLTLIVSSSAYSKPLPPGAGNSIKANIMFMVDKSLSMWWSSSVKGRQIKINPFTDVVPRGDGKYITASVENNGFGLWNPYQNDIHLDPNFFGNYATANAWQRNNTLNLKSPLNMEVRRVQNDDYLYILQDKTHEKANGYTLMSISTKVPVYRNGKLNTGNHSKNANRFFARSSGVRNGDLTGLRQHNQTKDKKGFSALVFNSKPSMDLYEDKILVISKEAWRVINLSNTNGHLNTDSSYNNGLNYDVTTRVCSKDEPMNLLFDDAIDIVKEGSKIYVYSKDGSNGLILKQEVDNNLCPTSNLYTQWNKSSNYDQTCGEGRGQSIAVRNNTIFTTGYNLGKVCKYSHSNSTIRLDKSIGTKDAYTPNAAGNPEVYIEKPMGISIGSGNSTETQRIYVASFGRNEVIIFNQSDLGYVDHFGDPGVSKWQGAIDSISNVLQDSTINQQANFGIGYWGPSGKAKFNGFNGLNGNLSNNNPRFDSPVWHEGNNPGAYISVGINPNGAQQILQKFSEDNIKLLNSTNGYGLRKLIEYYWLYNDGGGIVNPIIDGLDCQINATIIIGDGLFQPPQTNIDPPKIAQTLFDTKGHLTFTVGYGDTFLSSQSAIDDFINIA